MVALGGDGFMLQTLHSFTGKGKPIYGMNKGTVGFLMNEFHADDLMERLAAAEKAVIHPLLMTAHTPSRAVEARAFNEVSLLRETRQAAKIRILVDEQASHLRTDLRRGDWWPRPPALPPTIFPPMARSCRSMPTFWRSPPSAAFRPRRWRGALLPHRAKVRFEMLESRKRPVSAVADDFEVRDVTVVDVAEDRSISMTMLYDAGHNLDERILAEQFSD